MTVSGPLDETSPLLTVDDRVYVAESHIEHTGGSGSGSAVDGAALRRNEGDGVHRVTISFTCSE